MPSIEELERALIKAHRAGDVPNARAIAAEITASMSRREQPMEMAMPMPATPEPPKAEPETGFMAGLRAGFEGLKGDIAAIGATAGIKGAEEYAKGQREKQAEIYRQPEFSEAPVSYLTGLLGQSIPYMLAPVAAGFLAPEALGVAGATAAATAVSAGQFTGSNISRNLEEGKAAKDVDVAKSVAAAVPQALLDTLSLRMVPGLGKMFGKAGVQMTEAELEQVAKHGIVSGLADKVRQYGPAVLKTSLTEGATEAAQQVFERAQAGLNLTDEAAKKEYFDNFLGGALLGGTLAVPGRAIERGAARQEAEQKRDERLRGEEDTRLQAEAKAEAERKASPDYLLSLEPKLTELQDKVKELRQARGKKPGKNADPEAQIEWKEKTDEIRTMMEEMRDVQSEIKTNKPKIEKAKDRKLSESMTEQEYFEYVNYGTKAKEEDQTLESFLEQTKFTPKEEKEAPTTAENAVSRAQEALQPLRDYAEQVGFPLGTKVGKNATDAEKAQAAEHVTSAVEILMRTPALAQSIVDNNIRIPDFTAAESKAIVGAIKLQLEEKNAEQAERAKAMSEQSVNTKRLQQRLDAERYALRNIAQDPNNPVGTNEKIDKIIKLLEAKQDELGVESDLLRGSGAVTSTSYKAKEKASEELVKLVEEYRKLLYTGGAGSDALSNLLEKINLVAQPQRTEVIKEEPAETGAYTKELNRLRKEQDESFATALNAINVAIKYRRENPQTSTLEGPTAKAERARVEAKEKEQTDRFTKAVLQEIEANRRAADGKSLTPDEAKTITGRIKIALGRGDRAAIDKMRREYSVTEKTRNVQKVPEYEDRLRRQFAMPTPKGTLEERKDSLRTSLEDAVTTLSVPEKDAAVLKDVARMLEEKAGSKELVELLEEQLEKYSRGDMSFDPQINDQMRLDKSVLAEGEQTDLFAPGQQERADVRVLKQRYNFLDNRIKGRKGKKLDLEGLKKHVEEVKEIQQIVKDLREAETTAKKAPRATTPYGKTATAEEALAQGQTAFMRRTAEEFKYLTDKAKEQRDAENKIKELVQEEKVQRLNVTRTLKSLEGRINGMMQQLNSAVELVEIAARTARSIGEDSAEYKKIQNAIAAKFKSIDKNQIAKLHDELKTQQNLRDATHKAFVIVYKKLDVQRTELTKKRADVIAEQKKPNKPPFLADVQEQFKRKYNIELSKVNKNATELTDLFSSDKNNVIKEIETISAKIDAVLNFELALQDDATMAERPAVAFLRDFANQSELVKGFFSEASKIRLTITKLQESRAKAISAIAGEKRAAAAIEAGRAKTAVEGAAESQAALARETGLGLPGTKIARSDIKSDIAEAEDRLAEEKDRIEKMRNDREDMDSRTDVDKQEKSALTRMIKKATTKTVPNIESEIESLKVEARSMAEPAVKETNKPTGVLPAAKQETEETEEFRRVFKAFLEEKDTAREFDDEGFPITKKRGPYTKSTSPPQMRFAPGLPSTFTESTKGGGFGGKTKTATETQKTKAEKRIAQEKPRGEVDTSKTGWERFNKGDVMFRVGDENITPVSFKSVQSYIKQVKEGLPENVDFTFVENLDSLPKEFRDYMVAQGVDLTKNRIRGGVLPNGKVFVISNAHRSQSELELTIAHELIGHYGIDSMLGSKGIGALVRAIERGEGGIYGLAARLGPSVMDGVLVTSTAYNERIRAAKEANKPASEIAALEKARRVAMVRELVAYASETTNAQAATENKRFRDAKSLQELWKLIVAAFRNAAIKAGFKYIVKADTQDIYRFLRESTRSMADKTVGAYKTIDNEIVFARTATYGTIPVGVADTARKLVATQQRTMDRIKSEATGIGARTLYVDRFAPLERVAEYLKKSSQAMQMMYYARMHDQRSAWVGATVNSGAPKIQLDAKGNRIIVSGGGANLKDIAEELNKVKIAGMNAEGVRNLFTLYLAANRAKNKGIHVLNFSGSITQAELKEALRVGSSIPQFTKAQKLYNEYNNGLVDWLEQSGAISAKLAAELKKDQDYVPFYRAIGDSVVMEVGGMKPIAIGNIQQQPYLRELVGGDTKIQDFFNSALQNTSLLVDMGLRNLATKEAAFGLANAGLLGKGRIKIGTGPAQPNVLRFNKDGVEYHAIVDRESSEAIGIPAELLVRGMHGVVVTSGTVTKIMSIPAKWLRDMITRSPVYAARQVVRDSMSNFLLAGGNMTPVASAAKELAKMYAGVSAGEKKLQERGIIGGQLLTGTSEDMQKLLLQLTKGGLGWDLALAKLDRMHMKADASSRITLYNDYCKQGLSDMEATLATLESMNFSKRGVDSSLYSLNMMVPFLNSQIQGLNVLYQAFAGKLPYADKLAIQRKLYTRGMLLAGATIAYAMMMEDDDAYKNASMQDRLQNWFIRVPGLDQPIKVPIPFEIGLIFKAMPEAVMLAASKDQDASKVMIGMGKLLAMSSPIGVATAVPAGVKPILEATMNRSLYTGLDIESKAEQMLLPQERMRDKTSGVAKVLSNAISGITEAAGMPSKGISPIMIDYLISGYTGGTGLAIAQGISLLVPTDGPQSATKRLSDMPIIGSMFQPTDAGGQITTFYEKAEEYGEIKKTVDKLIDEGKRDEAVRLVSKYAKEITLSEIAESFKTDMNEFTQLETMTRASNMTPEIKRVKLNQIREAKIIFARSFNAASRQQ